MTDIDAPDDTARETGGGRGDGGILEIARTKVELWLVVIFMALAFGAGIAVMVMYEEPQPVVGVQQPVGQLPQAPPLTDEQIQSGLPTGHPDLSAGTGATGAVDAEQAAGDSGNGDGSNGSG